MKYYLFLATVLMFIFFSCKEDNTIKPPSKLRLDFPSSVYTNWSSQGGFTAEFPNDFVCTNQFNRTSEIKVGDVVEINFKRITDSRKNILTKIKALNIPLRGIVEELVPKVLVGIDLQEEELIWKGEKSSVIALIFKDLEIKKISQFEPFDVVEDVNLNSFHGNLKLHYVQFQDSVNLNYLSELVNNNVESHKFKSDRIEKEIQSDIVEKKYSNKYRFYGDMATTFQFVVHDSISQLVWGQVLIDFNRFAQKGYPTDPGTKERIMDRLEVDIDHFMKSLRWEK